MHLYKYFLKSRLVTINFVFMFVYKLILRFWNFFYITMKHLGYIPFLCICTYYTCNVNTMHICIVSLLYLDVEI